MNNFFKSILVGVFNILPGISGSAFLIVLGLYDKCLLAISNLFKDFKKSITFLLPIALGIAIGTYLFSNVIFYFLNKYPTITSLIFTGLIFGTIPSLIQESTKKGFKEKYLILFFITFSIGIMLLFYKNDTTIYDIDINIRNYILLFTTGILIASSTIIPDISSTVLLSLVGMYGIYINAINTINITILFPIIMGFLVGVFIFSKIITKLLNKYYGYTYFAILGFTISTIPALIKTKLVLDQNLIIGLILAIIAFHLTKKSLSIKKE